MNAQRKVGLVASVLLILAALPAFAVEHPGVLHQGDICSSCHADKTTGKSVHSAMTLPCTVCHLAQTQGDMTTVSLLMPKERICSACHGASAEIAQHAAQEKKLCVDCHDSHRSDRRMLLRDTAETPRPQMLPPRQEKE